MRPYCIAGLAGLAALGAQAQIVTLTPPPIESLFVTASRTQNPEPSLRDVQVITRAQLDDAGNLTLGEVLQRDAGIELRATGGPGQPESLFIRGANAAQTLVLIDGMRVNSATAGTTAIEAIPVEMIERIEIVKGPLSSLYGSQAAGGVIQIFTRGLKVPHLFAEAGLGNDRAWRANAGLSTADRDTSISFAAGAHRIDAPSATNPRATFSYYPDRDPTADGFATLHATHRAWNGEELMLDAFVSRSRTDFDAGPAADGGNPGERTDETLAGVRGSSSTKFASWWSSRIVVSGSTDKSAYSGAFPSRFETRQEQGSWINEFAIEDGLAMLGLETLRERVLPDRADDGMGGETVLFAKSKRTTNSIFGSFLRSIAGQHLEANVRRDSEDEFGDRTTSSLSYGADWPSVARLAITWATGFRAPTFNDLYGPTYPGFYTPNPNLLPERSKSTEIGIVSLPGAPFSWKLTGFDNRLEDLIVFSPSEATVLNVGHARIRGIEASLDARWFGIRWRGNVTVQRPRDDDTGARLQGRAERFGSLDASRRFGSWTAGLTVFASGDRWDSIDQSAGTRLPGYTLLDARVRYAINKQWTVELTGTNLLDRRYEGAVGYDASRRGVFLGVRFDAF